MPPIVDDLKMNNVLAYQSGGLGIRIADQEHCSCCDQERIPDFRECRPSSRQCSWTVLLADCIQKHSLRQRERVRSLNAPFTQTP